LHYGRQRRRIRRLRVVAVLVVIAVGGYIAFRVARGDSPHDYLAGGDWPTRGQASLVVGSGRVESSPDQRPVPIASVAKVMTAYLVLRSAPLAPGADGFRLTVTEADAENTVARQRNDESVVSVDAGEVLTERQALAALLLPSANNVAVMLARHVAGSVESFVNEMNRTARAMRMKHTTYTDPSGLDESTRSTGADQILLAQAAMRDATFASIVATPSYELPVAGAVRNTDGLLGRRGFVGIKTGSDDAAGGCFMFRTHRVVNGRRTDITGIVLGQRGDDLIAAALNAASQLADRVAPAP
jgi:D-alanyl-D-alanine carboxypeptidase (penicillin-binding protein 5/6)